MKRNFATLERTLLYVAVILLLMAQYVVNSHPWDHVFRLAALIDLVGIAAVVLVERVSKSAKDV